MITIKIQCLCGQKFAFDADPAETLLDSAVHCPGCGADSTEVARRQIARFSPSTASRNSGATANRPSRTASPALDPPIPRALPQRPRDTLRRAGRSWLVVGIPSGVLLLGALWAVVAESQGQRHAIVLSSARFDDGFPHTPAEVQAWYVEPDRGQNGAIFYQKGLDAFRMPERDVSRFPVYGNAEIPAPNASLLEPMRSDIGAYLRYSQVALDYFKQGSKFEENRYAVDLSAGPDTLFMHVEKLKKSSVLLEVAALFHADAQDAQHAAEDLEVGLALADSLKREPDGPAQVIRTLGVTRSVIALEQCLNRCFLPSESLTRLSQVLHRMEELDARGEGFNRALAAERANGLALLAAPDKLLQVLSLPGGTSTKAAQAQLAQRLEKEPTLELEIQFFKKAVRRILAARDREFPERMQSDLVARDEVAEARSKKLTALEAVLPLFAGRATQEGECLAELRLGATAVALEQYRRAHDNRYPDSLSALSPEYLSSTPVDPFQGRALVYQKKGFGYSLRSVEAKAGLGRHSQIRPRGLLIEVAAPPGPRL